MSKKTKAPKPPQIDFSEFLRVQNGGDIWWRLTDAVKLGAGYLPVCDDEQSLVTTLQAANNRVRANERTLLSEFSPAHYGPEHPSLVVRDDERFIEAQEFLEWLAGYLAASGDATWPFPVELARSVHSAKLAATSHSSRPLSWVSLTSSLQSCFKCSFVELPERLRARVEREFYPLSWDELSEAQRRSIARQNDDRNDPALESERKFWWDTQVRKAELEKQIQLLNDSPAVTARDHEQKRNSLKVLEQELAVVNRQMRSEELRRERSGNADAQLPAGGEGRRYVSFLQALKVLTDRFGATPEEMAAWVFMGSSDGGLSAYLNVVELNSPQKFSYQDPGGRLGGDFDYVGPLMACWFDEGELDAFDARDRYVTGAALCDRWRDKCLGRPEAFITARILESDLLDIHPITIDTQASRPNDEAYPPVAAGLYSLTHVEAVEAKFFPDKNSRSDGDRAESSSSLDAVTIACIALHFRVLWNEDANERWWEERAADAKRNGLEGCRVGPVRRGKRGGTLWRPDLIAGWLLNKKQAHRGMISPAGIRSALRKLPGYEQIADEMLLPE